MSGFLIAGLIGNKCIIAVFLKMWVQGAQPPAGVPGQSPGVRPLAAKQPAPLPQSFRPLPMLVEVFFCPLDFSAP